MVRKPHLLDLVRDQIYLKNYSIYTGRAYC